MQAPLTAGRSDDESRPGESSEAMSPTGAAPSGPARELSHGEGRFARRIQEVLESARVRYQRSDVEAPPGEPYVRFDLRTSAGLGLRIDVIVHGDVFLIRANEAEARVQSAAYPDGMEGAWLEHSVAALTYLVTHELRTKTRRGLLGRPTGAIYLGSASGERGWSGDLLAMWWGQERTYPDWLER